jgi:hypothetical protein
MCVVTVDAVIPIPTPVGGSNDYNTGDMQHVVSDDYIVGDVPHISDIYVVGDVVVHPADESVNQ